MVTRLLASAIALGGVPMGKSKAKEMDSATGVSTANGASPYNGPTQANADINTFAAATFDITFVQKQEIIVDIMMKPLIFCGPLSISKSANHSDKPEVYFRDSVR